ncbi:MAG: glycosyltransferase family 4 protein [Mucilaginibacter sp.]
MKLLFITPSLSYPPTKGYEVMLFKHIQHLSANHSIELVAFQDGKNTDAGKEYVKNFCDKIHLVKLPTWRSYISSAFGLFSPDPIQVRYYKFKKMNKLIGELLQDNEYDAVVFTLIRMAQYLPELYKGFTILNMVDPLILNYERSLTWRAWYTKLFLKLEIPRLKSYEKKWSQRFSRITLIAEADILDYKALLGVDRIDWLPYGIDVDYFTNDETIAREKGMIIISGNMGHAPNVDGVKYFCRDVFPLVLDSVPEARLWLVGINPSKEILKLSNGQNIIATGYVKDIKHYLNRAMVSTCPIRLKVGTQTKVLEALAMGAPVVTTSAGNHGVCGKSGLNLYVEDESTDFANKIVSLLKGDNWEELAINGRQFVLEKFRWDISVGKFEDILNKK